MRILVTGATGLLGQHLIPLVAPQDSIFSLGRSVVDLSAQHIPIDLSASWTSDALPKQIDVVIHLAQSARYRDFPDGAIDEFAVNLSSTAQLLDYARRAGAKRFILASTGGFCQANSSPITDDSEFVRPAELGHYFATKLAAEMIAGTYRPFMDVHVLRIFFMYGPGQQERKFLPALIQCIKSGELVRLNGTDGIHLNPIHAQDAARAIVELVRSGGPKTINLAGPQTVTIREIAEAIGSHLNVTPSFSHVEDADDLVAETDALRKLIGHYQFDMNAGLKSVLPRTKLGTQSPPSAPGI